MTIHPIFEMTMFWNEKGIFKERILNTLGYARALYIAEGNESHSGMIRRPFLVPELIQELPRELQRRVIHVPVDFNGIQEKNPFTRERMVRDAALQELLKNDAFNSESILLVQDFDEFIHPDRASLLSQDLFGWKFWRNSIRIRQRLSYFKIDLKDEADWTLALAVTGRLARTQDFSPNRWRHQIAKKKSSVTSRYYGWHHSYLGDLDFIRNKLNSFAEAEIDPVKKITDQQILERMSKGQVLYGEERPLEKVDYRSLDPIPALVPRTDLMFFGQETR